MANRLPDLKDGQVVNVTIEQDRSEASHRHQFAWLKTAWENLPEALAWEDWAQTTETLRKEALIRTGYFHQVVIDCGNDKIARSVAAEVGKARRASEGHARAIVRQGVAVIRWPESQSYKAMGKERFQQSKQAVLEWVADLIGVSPDELAKMGKEAA